MIRVESLTKRYGTKVAVDALDFVVEPGKVTGFLGPNGAGKSTTMRMIVGLDRPTSGSAEVNGRSYADLPAPLREVGVLLDARSAHKHRTAYKHLLAIAATHNIGAARVRAVLELAGLDAVADKRVGGFSLGMNQRLGIASALLGDPQTIILDEPVNGLDPDGILWIRGLLRQLAAEGRTVLLSSHLMSEMTQTADHLLIIGRGSILANGALQDVVADAVHSMVRVRTHEAERLVSAINATGASVTMTADGALEIEHIDAQRVAQIAAKAGILLHEVSTVAGTLEDAYLALTSHDTEYRAAAPGARTGAK